jgi:hypothetical protein
MSKKAIGFRAWITNNPDGPGYYEVSGSPDEFPSLVPKDGVIAVLVYQDEVTSTGVRYTVMITGTPFIIWWNGPDGIVIQGSSQQNTREELETRYPGSHVCQGRLVTDEIMDSVNTKGFTKSQDWPIARN